MAAPAAGVSYSGKSGIFALKSTDTGGVLAYHPARSINPRKPTGIDVPMLVNNMDSPSNYLQGIVVAGVSVSTLMFLGLHDADFYARGVLTQPDTSAAGYFDATIYPNNLGSAGESFYKSKFTQLNLSGSEGQPISLSFSLASADPESTTTALAAPAAGPVTDGQIATFEDCAFSGASDVKAFSMTFQPGTGPSGGVASGTNAKYPKVPAGLLEKNFIGTLTLTQVANPTTRLCGSSIEDTLTIDIGTADNGGIEFAVQCIETTSTDPVTVNERLETHSYLMFSSSDTGLPVSVADLAS